jgi:hypothetical protein
MIEIGTERIALQNRIWIDGWMKLKGQEVAITDASVPTGYGHLYVKDYDGDGNMHLVFKDDDDIEYDLCHQGGDTTTIIDQSVINNIINNFITQIINNVNSPTTAGHLHGLVRLRADGVVTTFYMWDYMEYLDITTDDGAIVDPTLYTISSTRDSVTFDVAPGDNSILTFNYVIARM